MKVKTNARDGESTKRANKLQEQKVYAVNQDVSQKSKRVVEPVPEHHRTQGNHFQFSESITMLSRKGAEASRRSFSEMPKDISPVAVSPGVPHSCPLPCEIERRTEKKWCSADAEGISMFRDSSHSVPRPAKLGISPSRVRISEVRKSTSELMNSTSKEPSVSKAAAEKPRSTSPFRRLSIGMGKLSKNFGSKEGSSTTQPSTAPNSSKIALENVMASSSHCTSSSDTQNATSRARSSPLRRLLDPLLKPKAPNCRQSGESLQRHSLSADRVCRTTTGQSDSSTGARQPGIIKFDMASCRAINVDNLSREKKHGSSAFQALLRVAIKNGQPLFTFAVDNERNILAATMKKLSSSREDDYNCIYTFFAIQEIKKKNGRWINQAGKGKGQNFIPNVVAQLKVSGSQFSHWTRERCMEQSFAREFVLFAVDLQQAEQQSLDSQSNDELAAIVVKIPKAMNRSAANNGQQTGKCNDLSEMRFNSITGEPPVDNIQSLVNATVILPSGIHSLPNKGGPSSLIQRWRSGGACDCGGWDLGCKLRVYANPSQLVKKSSSTVACSITDKFELISQGGDEENHPVFSLSPFKDGIYSVEFTSSLSVLQAFSLCIAVLDSKKLCEVSDSGNLFEGKTSLETMLSENDGIKAPNGNDGEVPARYVSYPPHSPVGRV
ncbi:hypothetical protein JCGZ_08552 [Jatropha curcas]|uniref:Uncharacterized protein n=1 Tax=Jatropha curcas TaxID=180498 RepID=A0A067LNY0_JATCU|nr:hypothetical protein JCGZ_08552 [Jatropha curcas]